MWAYSKRDFRKKILLIVAPCLVLVTLIGYAPSTASASLTACSVSLNPQYVAPGSDTDFTFALTNSSSNAVAWVKIVAPTGNYVTLEAAAASGWDAINTSGLAIFTNGTVPGSGEQDFIIEASADNATPSAVNWTIEASDDSGGGNPITCGGDTSLNITSQPSVINISDVTAGGITADAATITWTTDIAATTQVNYGTDSSYGTSSSLDSSLVTDHSVSLSGLNASTGYHYEVDSTTPDGGSSTSSDSTFLTADAPPPTTPPPSSGGSGNSSNGSTTTTTTVSGNILLGGGIPILRKPIEKVPPSVSLNSLPAKVFKTAPTISGVASDNVAVARIQYSTDGGKNWLPVDQATGLGSPQASFSFTPLIPLDGNYSVLVRAIDTSGNVGLTPAKTIIIDTLPPLVGGNIISLGPEILAPNSNGTVTSLVGVDQKVTLSAVGGPTSIVLSAKPISGAGKSQVFNLTQSSDTGLWSGIVSFTTPGQYTLVANAVDGANNKTARVLNNVSVVAPARTLDQKTHKPVIASVTVYYFEPESSTWVIWDGTAYGQANPQTTSKSGDFNLFLPPGKYYVQASAGGHQTLLSDIFQIQRPTPLTTNLELKTNGLKLGPLHLAIPTLSVQNVKLNTTQVTTSLSAAQSHLIGQPLPAFSLTDTQGNTVQPADLLGKPTVISFGATWSPTTTEQLQALSQLQADSDINVVPIAVQQDIPKVAAYTAIANLNLTWLVDPNGSLSNTYSVQSLPMNYFVNRKGLIEKVVVGVMTKQQILDQLSSL